MFGRETTQNRRFPVRFHLPSGLPVPSTVKGVSSAAHLSLRRHRTQPKPQRSHRPRPARRTRKVRPPGGGCGRWRPLGTNKNKYVLLFWGGQNPPKTPPRGPESTHRGRKRGPQAIPNDSRVDQSYTTTNKISRTVRYVDSLPAPISTASGGRTFPGRRAGLERWIRYGSRCELARRCSRVPGPPVKSA